MSETNLKYSVSLPNDGSHDQGVSLKFNKKVNLIHNAVVNPEDKRFFQRIRVFDNGFIATEEVWRDARIFRFNKPYKREGDTLFFEF